MEKPGSRRGAVAALCGVMAAVFALSSISEIPQRDRAYGWVTDRVLQVAGHGLLMLAVLLALGAVIAGIAWVTARKRARPSGG